jgi:excinuclease ABC subunit A
LGDFKKTWAFGQLKMIGERHGFTLETPIKNISQEGMDAILHGAEESFRIAKQRIGRYPQV